MADVDKSSASPTTPASSPAPDGSPFPRPPLDVTEKGKDPPGKETRSG